MGVPNGDLHDLERQRLELEGNILELQKSLYRWRTQEAEYDGLKEEFDELDDTATTEDFLQVGANYDETLLNEKELAAVVEGLDATRGKEQVIQLIIRRLDIVKQNVSTLEKMLRAAENKLHDLDAMERLPADPAADFPMTEIVENLDEDGNVISSSTNTPGNESTGLLELLKKAGVKEVPDTQAGAAQEPQNESRSEVSDSTTNDAQPAAGQTGLLTPDSMDSDDAPRTYHFEDEPATSQSAESQPERPVTNIDESPEDAQLRSDMLRYSLDEVGAVVAELELDESASDVSLDEDADVFAYDDEDEESEEDEFGRSTRSVLDDDYHQKMRELEAKLNARGMWNMGKDTGSLPEEVKEELHQPHKVRIEDAPLQADKPAAEKKPKKKVAFADELDIAPAPKAPTADKKTLPPRESDVQVLSDSVVERTEPATKDPAPKAAPKKASRFKSARNSAAGDEATDSVVPVVASGTTPSSNVLQRKPGTSSAPSPSSLPLFPAKPAEPRPFSQPIQDISEEPRTPKGPKDKILADTLVERDISEGGAAPPEPDELDEQLHRKEIASEFYRARNRRIKENEGFVDNEPEIVPIETEDAPKKVSKFKAARMR